MTKLEPLPRLVLTWRRIGIVPIVLRAVTGLASASAIGATTSPAFDVPNVYVIIAVAAGAVWTVAPDSAAGLVFALALTMAWLAGGTGDLDAGVVIAAFALLVAHVAAALAAAMPVTARADPALLRCWLRPTAGIAAGVPAAAGLLAGLDAWSPAASVVATVGALVLVTAGAWWWSLPPDGGNEGFAEPDAPR